jgi:hypothetical protein
LDNLPDFNVLGFVNYHPEIAEADRLGKSVFETAPKAVVEAIEIKKRLEELIRSK